MPKIVILLVYGVNKMEHKSVDIDYNCCVFHAILTRHRKLSYIYTVLILMQSKSKGPFTKTCQSDGEHVLIYMYMYIFV